MYIYLPLTEQARPTKPLELNMHRPLKCIFSIFIFCLLASNARAFEPLDASQFKESDRPWLGEHITIVSEANILGSYSNYGVAPVKADVVRRLSKYFGKPRLILDIESWAIRKSQKLDAMAAYHAHWYLQVLQWAHEALPGTDIGYFGFPSSGYHALDYPDRFMHDYQEEMKLMTPVFEESDSLYPDFYVYYTDIEHLKYTWAAQLYHSKAFGKPVYPFMWHRGPGSIHNYRFLPDQIIREQCKFVRTNADGLVWWSISWETWNGESWYNSARECFY